MSWSFRTYSDDGRVLAVANGAEVRELLTYDISGRVETDSLLQQGPNTFLPFTEYQYDDLATGTGLPRFVTSPNGDVTATKYDSSGNVLATSSTTNFTSATTKQFYYDALGRLVKELDPVGFDSSMQSVINTTSQWAYAGLTTTYTDPSNHDSVTRYDRTTGTQIQTFQGTDPSGSATTYTLNQKFNSDGSLQSAAQTQLRTLGSVMLDDSTVAFQYDEFGRQIEQDVTSQIDGFSAPAVQTNTTYYAGGQVHTIQDRLGSGTSQTLIRTATYALDGLGRVGQVTDDLASNAAAWWLGSSVGQDKTVDFTYNADDQLASVTRYAAVNDSGAALAGSTYGYSADGRIRSISHSQSASNTPIASFTTIFDAAGRLASKSTELDNANGSLFVKEDIAYVYDDNGQLLRAATFNRLPNQNDPPVRENLGYDSRGNPRNQGTAAVYSDRMTQYSNAGLDWTYQNDNAGRVTQRKSVDTVVISYQEFATSTSRIVTDTPNWDDLGRINSLARTLATSLGGTIVSSSSAGSIRYVYDALGREIGRVETDATGNVNRYAIVYDASGETLEIQLNNSSGGGQILRHEFNGPGQAGVLAVDQTSASGPTRTVWSFADASGTVAVTASVSGTAWTQLERDFNSRGAVTQTGVSTTASLGDSTGVAALQAIPVVWHGQEADTVLKDLYLAGSTIYDPQNGRYLNQSAADGNPYRADGNRFTAPGPLSMPDGVDVSDGDPGYSYYFRNGWAAQGFGATGNFIRSVGDTIATPFTYFADNSSSPAVAAVFGFSSGLVQLPFDLAGGLVDIPGLAGGIGDRYGAYSQAAGGGDYGAFAGVAGASGVTGLFEAQFGTDVLTGAALTGDETFDRTVIGAGTLGGIILAGSFGANAASTSNLLTAARAFKNAGYSQIERAAILRNFGAAGSIELLESGALGGLGARIGSVAPDSSIVGSTGIANGIATGMISMADVERLKALLRKQTGTAIEFDSRIAQTRDPQTLKIRGNHFDWDDNTIRFMTTQAKTGRGVFFEEIQHALDYQVNPKWLSRRAMGGNDRLHAVTFNHIANNTWFELTHNELMGFLQQADDWARASGRYFTWDELGISGSGGPMIPPRK